MSDTTKEPSITIVTPSYNQGKFIKRTIESVLSQGVQDIEYLIFDGGSTDETMQILKSYGDALVWVSESDNGQANAVNKGLRAAKGGIIGWLNSDDIYYRGALHTVLDTFERHPGVDILYGLADHIDEFDNVIEPYYNEEWNYERLKELCFICQPAAFFRRSIVERFGLLDETLHYCLDYEYWLRIGREMPFYYLKQKLAGSRLYPENKTLGSAVAAHKEVLLMFKEKYPPIPDRWIFNHAHVVARDIGLKDGSRKFLRKVISVALWDSVKLRYHVPRSMIKTISGWIRSSVRLK